MLSPWSLLVTTSVFASPVCGVMSTKVRTPHLTGALPPVLRGLALSWASRPVSLSLSPLFTLPERPRGASHRCDGSAADPDGDDAPGHGPGRLPAGAARADGHRSGPGGLCRVPGPFSSPLLFLNPKGRRQRQHRRPRATALNCWLWTKSLTQSHLISDICPNMLAYVNICIRVYMCVYIYILYTCRLFWLQRQQVKKLNVQWFSLIV